MTPLENLDFYMFIFVVVCGLYITFMLLLLACFLRKFSPLTTENFPAYSQPIEMRQMKTYTLSDARQAQLYRCHGSRSNRSLSSSRPHAHMNRKKILVMRRPDISQMERLATL